MATGAVKMSTGFRWPGLTVKAGTSKTGRCPSPIGGSKCLQPY